jgi:hypothetical protein
MHGQESILGGEVHEAAKFGGPLDPVEGRKRAAIRTAHARRATAEIEALRAEERSWTLWCSIVNLFGRRGN